MGGLGKLTYEERLKKLNMFSIERRFIREDLIEIYKIVHQLENIKLETFFEYNNSVTRGHSLLRLRTSILMFENLVSANAQLMGGIICLL